MKPRTVLFTGNFFFSMFATLTTYIMLPYLSLLMPPAYTGLAIAAGALVALILFPFQPLLVRRFGAQELALFFASALMASLFGLAASPPAWLAVILVGLTISLQPFLYYELDLLLEATVAEESTTGRVRTLFLTAWDVGGLAAPVMMGALLASGDEYGHVFLAAGAALLPFVVVFAAKKLPAGGPPKVSHLSDTLRSIMGDRDLAAVTVGHVILYLFYIWAPLYVPIYLHEVVHIPWSTLGWMFSVMLLPYVLLQYPAGWLADKYLGDKEMMFLGFIIAGTALASFSVVTPATSLALILVALVASRVGSALIESMTEGHFFRRVSERDVSSISVFRGIWPLSNLLGPLIGSALLFSGDYQFLFATTGVFVVLSGMLVTALIRDFVPLRLPKGGTAFSRERPTPPSGAPPAPVPSGLSVPFQEATEA